MRIVVYGTGGVGGYFGGRLAHAREDVTFIARGENLRAILVNGLQVDSINGNFLINPVQVTDDPRQVGKVDMVLVCVKAWQIPEIAPLIRPLIGEKTGVLSLGNGVDALSQLAVSIGSEHVLGGVTRISSFKIGPGHIDHVGIEPTVTIGELDGELSERVEHLHSIFENAGVNVIVPEDILVAIWEKFLFITAFSGIGAVTRASVGILRSVPETRQMLELAIKEIEAIARSRKINLPMDVVDNTMEIIDGIPPDVLASMQRDILEGWPSELGAQIGAVVRMGLESGVATPVNTFVYNSLLPQELKARGELSF